MVTSAVALSYELDDVETASVELVEQIHKKIQISGEGIGILHGHAETEIGALSALLHQKLGIDIIGGTTAGGATLTNEGHHELAFTLHVITSNDNRFSAAISASLQNEPEKGLIDVYNHALDNLKTEPKLMFYIAPFVQNIAPDEILQVFEKETDRLPIFGYIAADDFDFENQRIFLNGECGGDLCAVLLFGGNLKPVFAISNLYGSETITKKQVTKSSGSVITEIDGKPAYEYIKEFPFINDETQFLWNYQFFVETNKEDDADQDDRVIVSRALNSYNKDTGEIYCFGHVPEGAYISLQYCDSEDVKASCEKALLSLNEAVLKNEGYRYTTLLVVSCSLRNMFLANQKDAEGELIKKLVPPTLTTSGIYSFGEIAPVILKNGKIINSYHNATITICVI